MKIGRVDATGLRVSVPFDEFGVDRIVALNVCHVEVETDDGLIGYGFTAIVEGEVVANIVNAVAGPLILGEDPMANERIWERLYWKMSPRGQTGYASHAIAAIDVALWDIKGKYLNQPVWRLLGGARGKVETYATFGFPVFDREQLAEAARTWQSRGHRKLKMVVANEALPNRDTVRPVDDIIREDAMRVRAVREAIGDDVDLFIDANCRLDPFQARKLTELIEDCGVTYFEEPITHNDVRQLAKLRQLTSIPLAAGQNEGLAWRFRDMLVHEAVDYLQPNVVIGGGFTQCVKIAGMAAAFNVPICNGGAWMHHNMHLHAGVANGTMVRAPLCRDRDLQADVSRSPRAGRRLAHLARDTWPRLHARPRRDPRAPQDVIGAESRRGARRASKPA